MAACAHNTTHCRVCRQAGQAKTMWLVVKWLTVALFVGMYPPIGVPLLLVVGFLAWRRRR